MDQDELPPEPNCAPSRSTWIETESSLATGLGQVVDAALCPAAFQRALRTSLSSSIVVKSMLLVAVGRCDASLVQGRRLHSRTRLLRDTHRTDHLGRILRDRTLFP